MQLLPGVRLLRSNPHLRPVASTRVPPPSPDLRPVPQPTVPPSFSRSPLAGTPRTVMDKGRPTEQAGGLLYLNVAGVATLDRWSRLPAGDHVIDMPLVSELPGWPNHNTMLARRLTDGGVMVRPRRETGIPYGPNLFIQPTADASRVQYKLNGRVLDLQSPLADLYLAMELVETLYANS